MAISKVSFFKTPQANDDNYYWTEDALQQDSKVYNATTGYLTLDGWPTIWAAMRRRSIDRRRQRQSDQPNRSL